MHAFLKFLPALEEKHRQWQLAQHTFWTMGSRVANLPNFPCEQCCNIFNRVLAAAKQWEVCLVLLDTMCSHRRGGALCSHSSVPNVMLTRCPTLGFLDVLAEAELVYSVCAKDAGQRNARCIYCKNRAGGCGILG